MDSELVERVIGIINTCLSEETLTMEQYTEDLSQYQIDSFVFIRIIVAIEEEFEIVFPDEVLIYANMNTIESICNEILLVQSEKSEKGSETSEL